MIVFVLLLNLVAFSAAFQCYTCNDEPHDDDTKPCHDMKSDCPSGVNSCSMLVYRNSEAIHMRKFCTPRNTPLYQYLQLLPGSSMCQNVNTKEVVGEGQLGHLHHLLRPLLFFASVQRLFATGALISRWVIENTMMNNLPKQRLPQMEKESGELMPPAEEPAEDIQMQMADAGF